MFRIVPDVLQVMYCSCYNLMKSSWGSKSEELPNEAARFFAIIKLAYSWADSNINAFFKYSNAC